MEHTVREKTAFFRRTIMKHEEIFRYQVNELHRLYLVQKSLMTELNQPDQNFNSYSDSIQRMDQDKKISQGNFRTSASTSGTSRYKEYYDIHSDGESDGIDLSLALGNGIGSRPGTKSNSAGVPWLNQALN